MKNTIEVPTKYISIFWYSNKRGWIAWRWFYSINQHLIFTSDIHLVFLVRKSSCYKMWPFYLSFQSQYSLHSSSFQKSQQLPDNCKTRSSYPEVILPNSLNSLNNLILRPWALLFWIHSTCHRNLATTFQFGFSKSSHHTSPLFLSPCRWPSSSILAHSRFPCSYFFKTPYLQAHITDLHYWTFNTLCF